MKRAAARVALLTNESRRSRLATPGVDADFRGQRDPAHQIGGFLGAWLGGIALAQTGNYEWIWYADIFLALLAAAVNLPIREARLDAQPAAA